MAFSINQTVVASGGISGFDCIGNCKSETRTIFANNRTDEVKKFGEEQMRDTITFQRNARLRKLMN